MLLEKEPAPVPLVVWLLFIVGLVLVLQHTPLAVTLAPPVAVTLPPLVAVEDVMFETVVVVTVGSSALVINNTCDPYAVPELLVA